MIKDYKRYRNFMIVFDEDRYYVCKADSFSDNGDNRYTFGEFETVNDAKKRIDEYYENKEEESMIRRNIKRESCNEDLEVCDEKEEILNEYDDDDDEYEDDIPYPKNPNLLNLIDYYMDKYDMDEDNATECARGDLSALGCYTRYFDESVEIRYPNGKKANRVNIIEALMNKYNISARKAINNLNNRMYTVGDIKRALRESIDEATNPSSIGHFKKSVIGSKTRNPKKVKEDRIITKDDELNKSTNVKDDTQDKIEINVKNDQNNSNSNNSNNNKETNGDSKKIEESEMTEEEKDEWTKNAKPEELLSTWMSMSNNNRYGIYQNDIDKVYKEIIRRMSK